MRPCRSIQVFGSLLLLATLVNACLWTGTVDVVRTKPAKTQVLGQERVSGSSCRPSLSSLLLVFPVNFESALKEAIAKGPAGTTGLSDAQFSFYSNPFINCGEVSGFPARLVKE